MGFLIARISGSALAAVLALIAFILQLLIRKDKLPALWVRVISGLGAVGALYVLIATIGNVLKYTIGVSSLLTVFVPLLVHALVLAVYFALVFSTAKWREASKPYRIARPTLAVAVVVSIQLALGLFNLIRNWNNFTHGMIEFLYIQLVYLILIIVSVTLFWINFAQTKKFAASVKT